MAFSIPCCGDTLYVTESSGMIAHGLSQYVSSVRVGSDTPATYIDLNVAVANAPITVTLSEGKFFSAVPFIVNPPTGSPSSPGTTASVSLIAK